MMYQLEVITEINAEYGVVTFKGLGADGNVYTVKGTKNHIERLIDMKVKKGSLIVVRAQKNVRNELLLCKVFNVI